MGRWRSFPSKHAGPTARETLRTGTLARLDRIPVWPWERKLLWVVGAGYFFAFVDIVTISYALPVIAAQFHASKATVALSVTSSLIGYIIGAFADSTSGWRILFGIGALGGVTILFMRRGLPPSPRWPVTQGRTEEAREVVAEAEETARETMGEELPRPEPVPEEALAERFPIKALLKQPMIGRLALFVGGLVRLLRWQLRLAHAGPDVVRGQGLQPRRQHDVFARVGHRLLGGGLRDHPLQ